MLHGLRISAVLPCYNEQDGIRHVLERMPKTVDEVVVVDNRSTDRTAKVAQTLGARVVSESRRGYGAAYKTGLAAATGDLIVTLDGDGSYPPEEIPRLIDEMRRRGLEFLSCARFPLANPAAMGFTNRVGNGVLTVAAALLFGKAIRDSQSGMWIFPRAVLARLRLTSDGMAFSEEIKLEAIQQGLRFGEAHIPYGDRVGVVKLQKWRDGATNLAFLVRKRLGWLGSGVAPTSQPAAEAKSASEPQHR